MGELATGVAAMSAPKENKLEAGRALMVSGNRVRVPRRGVYAGRAWGQRESFEHAVLRGGWRLGRHAINRDVPPSAIDKAIRRVVRQDHPTLIGNNQ